MRIKLALTVLLLVTGFAPLPGRAAVVVLANRTGREVRFTVTAGPADSREHAVAAGDVLPLPVVGRVEVSFPAGGGRRSYQLDPNTAYFFGRAADGVELREIGLGSGPAHRDQPDLPPPPSPNAPAVVTIPVRILVDEDEPAARPVWEARLHKRLKAASDVLERACRVRFEVVAVGTWESDNGITTFEDSLREFERKVSPAPGRLALGFTSQYKAPQAGVHLGVTRQPLYSHILLREWFPRSEAERLEVLVHELGHYLGATHSPEPDSVMRPRTADGRALRPTFRLGFDPVNTLAMNLVADDMRCRGARSWRELSPATRERLRDIYDDVAQALPDDPSAAAYHRLTEKPPSPPNEPPSSAAAPAPLVDGARRVLAAVVGAAEQNHALPAGTRLTGDRLLEHYYRVAGDAAADLPKDQAVPAFLIGLAVAVDDSDLLRTHPVSGSLWRQLETDAEFKHRAEVLGDPSVHGRHDLAQHFAVSGGLTALAGPAAAESVGILKELLDSRPGGSGFSFADLSADLAGVAFATRLREAPGELARRAKSFRVRDYALPPAGLTEGLTMRQFTDRYGSVSDDRFRKEKETLRERVLALPGYHEAAGKDH